MNCDKANWDMDNMDGHYICDGINCSLPFPHTHSEFSHDENKVVELASTAPEFRPDMVAVPRELVRECENIITDYAPGYTVVLRKLREVLGDD